MEEECLIGWCQENDLLLNMSKTKEVIVDFRWRKCDLRGDFVEKEADFHVLGVQSTLRRT